MFSYMGLDTKVNSSEDDETTPRLHPHGLIRRRAQVREIRVSSSTEVSQPEPSPTEKENAPFDHSAMSSDTTSRAMHEEKVRKGGKGAWNPDETNTYYEAVKMVGKEFDAIVRLMRKKKNVHKDRDQIRNYFFNCVKFVKSTTDIDMDEAIPDLCKDAKELFLVINAGEWRKRTGGAKYLPDKMKELIFEGSTTVKWNKRNLIIKTPSCPALQKFFTETRNAQSDRFLSEVVIALLPATHSDRAYVMSCQQNPILAVRISTNEKISRIFELLHRKWSLPLLNDQKKIFLRPARNTDVGEVIVSEFNAETEQISINRLKEEMDRKHEKGAKRDKTVPYNTVSTYTAVSPNPFTINGKMLLQGISAESVGDASVAELYCLCGMVPEFSLVYSIDSTQRKTDSWMIFRDLMSREYGDQLTGTKEEEGRGKIGEAEDEHIHHESKRIRLDAPPKVIVKAPTQRASAAAPQVIHSDVVNEENEKFIQSLLSVKRGLRDKKASKARGKKQKPSPEDLIPAVDRTNAFLPLTSKVLPYSTSSLKTHPDPVDFSQMAATSSSNFYNQHPPTYKEYNNGPTEPSGGMEYYHYEGSLFEIPMTREEHSEEHATQGTMDRLFGEVSRTPVKLISTNSLGSSDSIQKMAHRTMHEVLSQNSCDLFDGIHSFLEHISAEDSAKPWPTNL